jgi:hypothetical protein
MEKVGSYINRYMEHDIATFQKYEMTYIYILNLFEFRECPT